MKPRLLRPFGLALVATLTVIAPLRGAHAFDLGKAWNKLMDAGHDVVTLGQHGRDRDKERAEAQRRESEIARAAAEKQRQLEIDALTKDVRLLRDVTKTFESSTTAATTISDLQNELLERLHAEITARDAALGLVERVRDFMRGDSEDLASLARVLSWDAVREQTLESAFGNKADTSALEALRKNQQASLAAFKAKLDVIEKTKLTEDAYLKDVVKRLKTSSLRQVLVLVHESRIRLLALNTELEASRRNFRSQLAAQLDALAALSKVDRGALAKEWESNLLPASTATASAPGRGGFAGIQEALQAAVVHPMAVMALKATPQPTAKRVRICMSFGTSCFDTKIQQWPDQPSL